MKEKGKITRFIKKFFTWIFIILAVIIALAAGIIMSKSLKTKKEQNLAEKNAISYIEKKYGFTPEVIGSERYYEVDVDFDILITYSKTPTDDYLVRLRHEGKEFKVYISFTEVTDKGRDDYQSDEVNAAVKDSVASYFDGKVMAIDGGGHKNLSFHYCMEEYFDGSHVEKFYHEGAEYYIYTVGSNLAAVDFDKMLKEIHASKVFVFDYKVEGVFEKRYDKNPFGITDAEKGSISLDSELPFLDEYALIRADSESEYAKVELTGLDDFFYYSPYTENISVYKSDALGLENWDTEGNVSLITGGYTVSADAAVTIYVPKSIAGGQEQKIGILYTYTDKNGNRHYKESHDFSDKEDEHAMFYLYEHELNNLEFMIVKKQ